MGVDLVKVNVPVRLQSDDQDVVIDPEDLLIGDMNGVVCVPKALAVKVLRLMPSQVEADEKVAEDLKRGRGFANASGEWRKGVMTAKDL